MYADENTSETILHKLAVEGKAKVIKFLLEKAKEKNILNDILTQGNMHGFSAIQLSYRGRYEIIQLLLDNGADPKNILQETYFAEKVDENVLKLLMEYAIRDPNYEPGEDAHQRVKDMFAHYKQQKEEKDEMEKRMAVSPRKFSVNQIAQARTGPPPKSDDFFSELKQWHNDFALRNVEKPSEIKVTTAVKTVPQVEEQVAEEEAAEGGARRGVRV